MKATNDRMMLSEVRARAQRYLHSHATSPAVQAMIADGLNQPLLTVQQSQDFLEGALKFLLGLKKKDWQQAADGYWIVFSLLTPVAKQNSERGWFADLLDAANKPMLLGEDRLRRLLLNVPLFSAAESAAIVRDDYEWKRDRYEFSDPSGRKQYADAVRLEVAGQPVACEPSKKYWRLMGDPSLKSVKIWGSR